MKTSSRFVLAFFASILTSSFTASAQERSYLYQVFVDSLIGDDYKVSLGYCSESKTPFGSFINVVCTRGSSPIPCFFTSEEAKTLSLEKLQSVHHVELKLMTEVPGKYANCSVTYVDKKGNVVARSTITIDTSVVSRPPPNLDPI